MLEILLLVQAYKLLQMVTLTLVLLFAWHNSCRSMLHSVLEKIGMNHLVFFPRCNPCVFLSIYPSKWTIFLCSTPGTALSFLSLKLVVWHHFLPHLVCHPSNDVKRLLFSLPAYLRGLDPCVMAAKLTSFLDK